MTSLAELQKLYDRNRFLEAFRESAGYWNPSVRLQDFSSDELILGGRLATRLGGRRLSRWLFRAALDRNPSDARVRYFTSHIRGRNWRFFDQLRAWEASPELSGADPDTQASWLASQAVIWASLRDFTQAHWLLARAHSYQPMNDWVLSCESDVFGFQDRWSEALQSAELAWENNPGAPYSAHSLGESLLKLRGVSESAERLACAAETGESYEVAHLALWHLCALAETLEGEQRLRILGRAKKMAERLPILAPLADREARTLFARGRLDIAELEDDHEAMEHWAEEVRSPFHRTVLKNLRRNPKGQRIRLPFTRAVQKHDACLPTSIASALAAMGMHIDPDEITSELTFGGTPEWAAAQWLEKRGLVVRFFAVTPEIAARLIKNGFAFVVTLEADASAHAVAVVGLDEAAGTLLVHDPQAWRTTEYLIESIGQGEAPLGPKGMAVVPGDRVELLDQLLPAPDVEAVTATEDYHRATILHGPAAAREIVDKLRRNQPSHPITRLLSAFQAVEDGRVGTALNEFQHLLRAFPNSAHVRARLLSSCRALGNTALMRATLASVVERGMLPGIQSQQNWVYPPGAYVSEYADLLRASVEARDRASSLLHGAIHRESTCAQAWHVLGDLLSGSQDAARALLGYRIASGLASNSEHYARAYCDALGNSRREEDGLKWLEDRVRQFGRSPQAVATWVTWISALEDWGRPEQALAAAEEALKQHENSPELLAFVVPFVARMGQWEKAEALLKRLEAGGNPGLFLEAAVYFYRMRGDIAESVRHAEDWVRELPLATQARRELLHSIAKHDGPVASLERASRWLSTNRGHDDLEEIYCLQLDRASAPRWKKYLLLRRRTRRNPDDGWAWRELVFFAISQYASADDQRRERWKRRIPKFLAQCDRTAPDDAATLRAHAEWSEARGDWPQALEEWLKSIDRDPGGLYSYQNALECLARFDSEKRLRTWQQIAALLPGCPGRLTVARDTTILVAQKFSLAVAEEAVSSLRALRPDDPELVEASVDLLLEHGQGRTDAQRALGMLEPAVKQFPYHIGLRFSLADALRKLARFDEAEEVLGEILRRHPGNSSARIQLARVHERHGRIDEALRVLEFAAARDPQNADISDVRAQILIGAGRLAEARAGIAEALSRFERTVHWRERAIKLFMDCGDNEAAVSAAREGVRVHRDGAYLWFLLGRTLSQLPRFAAQGEVESCFRRSLALNAGLFIAADSLVMLLVEQRRYAEAEEVLIRIRDRLNDPSPARGRLAWIHREQGNKLEAREEMACVLSEVPWYTWGWSVLMDWLAEDKAWNDTRRVLAVTPPQLKTHTQFRRQRLMALEKAGLPAADLDSEWSSLLHDFPEDVSLHLHRYDSLRDTKRLAEAAAVLDLVHPSDSDSPYVLARFFEVLVQDQTRRGEAIQVSLKVLFAETEESVWPVNHVWSVAKQSDWQEEIYKNARDLLQKGSRPTPTAFSNLASYATLRSETAKRARQPFWRTWIPDRGAREVLTLLKMVDSAHWADGIYRSILLQQLSDVGYQQLVVKYWKRHKVWVETVVESWAQTGRALVALKRGNEARKLMAGWRERTGVAMWVVTNYVMCFSTLRPKHVREVLSSCRDALAGLPHDHCAKYLVHRQAEACALLGDRKAFRDTWDEHRNYLDGKLEKTEWFEVKRRYLLSAVPTMARALEQNQPAAYRRTLWRLRWKSLFSGHRKTQSRSAGSSIRWWWIIVAIWLLFQILSQSLRHP